MGGAYQHYVMARSFSAAPPTAQLCTVLGQRTSKCRVWEDKGVDTVDTLGWFVCLSVTMVTGDP